MTIKHEPDGDHSDYAPALLTAGGLLGALAASSCCILPLALFGLGASGAWIGNFTRLAPYQPCFLVVAVVCLGIGGRLVATASTTSCDEGEACARPLPRRVLTTALVAAGLLVVAAIGFDLFGPLLFS